MVAAYHYNGAVKIAEDKQKALEAQAYTKLSFTPALPASLPTGWEQGSGRGTVYGDGQPPIPKALPHTTSACRLVKLSDFSLDGRCGPTIGGGGDYLSRYLYRPIGDALVQVSATKCCSLDIRSIPQKELTAQDALVKTLQPTSKEMFKDAKYQPGASVFL